MAEILYVVDDDPLVTESLGTALRLETRETIRAYNHPEEALADLAAFPPAIVISDFKMGAMDGVRFLAAVRAAVPDAILLLLTGYADKESAIAAINQAGIYQYIEKPWDLTDLLAKLRAALDKRALERRLAEKSIELERSLEELSRAQGRLIESARLAAVGRVVSGIAHELGNQLAIVGAAEAIRARTSDPELRDLAEMILAAQRRLVAMVDEIREFVRGQGPAIQPAPMPLAGAIDDALAVLRFDPEVRRRCIVRRGEAAPLVRGDRGKLAQVVINLVRNAAQASSEGAELLVELREEATGALLVVRDAGAGMAPDLLARIGEPFFSTKGDAGTGLGLALSRAIVEAHGGTLAIDSLLGRGTTVTVTLPPLPSAIVTGPAAAASALSEPS